MSDSCNEKSCVLCNSCYFCEGSADIYYPKTQIVVCIDCVKANLLDDIEAYL